MSGLPGLRGAEHIGITVPDMAKAVDFFTRVLGCDFVLDGGRVADPALMREVLGVDPSATMHWAFLRCGAGPNIELFVYNAPDQVPQPPRNSDIGGHHIALYVDDMVTAEAHLRDNGVEIMGAVQHITEGPAAGSRWLYFRAPWGLQLELVSYPAGKGPQGGPARRLWHPGHPDR